MPLNSLLVTLVRHGESQDNLQSIWAGWRDTPLSPTGISQARALGQTFANVNLTAIYSSDLKRAAMTAEEVLLPNRSIPPPPLVQSKSLREQNFGQAEGKSWASAEWANPAHGDDARSFRFKEGESLEDVHARMAKSVRQFVLPRVEAMRKKPATSPQETPHICIVAHGIAIAELLRVFMALHQDHAVSPWSDPRLIYKRVRLENTGWTRLELAVPLQDSDVASMSNNQPIPPTDFGEIQADMVEGSVETSRQPATSTPEDSSKSSTLTSPKPIYVRILCQNQVDHLRGFALQPPSMSSGGPANQLAGGGAASMVGSVSSPNPSGTSAAVGIPSVSAAANMTLPALATLTSSASNATLSTSASLTTLPLPSTPGASSVSAPRSVAATPASARSLNNYDAKLMARELERAGAAAMLSGIEAGSAQPGATSTAPTSQGLPPAERQLSTPALGASSQIPAERPGLPTTSTSSSTLHSLSANQIPTSVSSLYNAYASAGANANASGASPNTSSFGFPNNPGSSSDVWQGICVRVLPLFNGEPLRSSIEELNESVSLHVRRTLERSPARAVESLCLDLTSLASSGTLTLNSKLVGLDDSRLLVRLVEIWTFFLGQILPYIEGCFLPFHTDPSLMSLTSAARSNNATATQAGAAGGQRSGRIDTRRMLLAVFRDQVILPIYERLFYLFAHITELDSVSFGSEETVGIEGNKQVNARLLQMTSVLASILSDDEAQMAMDGLLRALRIGSKGGVPGRNGAYGHGVGLGMGTASPVQRNNRRGWIPQKARKHGVSSSMDSFGPDTNPSGGAGLGSTVSGPASRNKHALNLQAGKDRRFGYELSEDEYLTALKSPNGSPAVSTPRKRNPTDEPGMETNDNTWKHYGIGEGTESDSQQEAADSEYLKENYSVAIHHERRMDEEEMPAMSVNGRNEIETTLVATSDTPKKTPDEGPRSVEE